jgi:hypothetical protein
MTAARERIREAMTGKHKHMDRSFLYGSPSGTDQCSAGRRGAKQVVKILFPHNSASIACPSWTRGDIDTKCRAIEPQIRPSDRGR